MRNPKKKSKVLDCVLLILVGVAFWVLGNMSRPFPAFGGEEVALMIFITLAVKRGLRRETE